MKKKYLNDILNNQINFSFTTNGMQIKQANQSLLNFFGYKSLDMFVKEHSCICDFFLQGDGYLQKFQNNKTWLEVILEDLNKNYKVKIKNKDGKHTIFQISTNGKKINKNDIVITLMDITETEEYKNTLKDQLKESSKFLEKYSEAVVVSQTDLNGKIIFVSNAFSKISGYSADELLGRSHNILRHPDMPDSLFKNLWETITKGEIWKGKIKNKRKDGSFYWVEAIIYPNFDDNKNLIGYTAIRQDISHAKTEKELHKKLKYIFDNVPIGFLIIDKNANVTSEYSNESLKILSLATKPTQSKISEILFQNNETLKNEFDYGYYELMNTSDQLQKELLLSLLPQEHTIKSITFSIEYKLIENNNCLIILKDITQIKELELKVQHERQLQKMIIAIVTNTEEAIKLIEDFKKFINDLDSFFTSYQIFENKLITLNRKLHTFKGLFAQKEMVYITDAIHEAETTIELYKDSIEQVSELIKSNLQVALVYDTDIIKKTLGSAFFNNKATKNVSIEQIQTVRDKIIEVINYNKPELLYEVLDSISIMMDKPLFDMLSPYINMINNMAVKLDKNIKPLNIDGDRDIFISNWYESFIKSLVHIFRNSIDHGIEYMTIREMCGKDIEGTISCRYEKIDDNIVIIISDDGAGIDIDKVLQKAIKKGLVDKNDIANLTDETILNFIFEYNFSTNDNIDLLSGRGIGLDVVMYELKKLNGSVEINTTKGKGTSFLFTIPYNQTNYSKSLKYKNEDIILNCITKTTQLFLQNDIGIKVNNITKNKNNKSLKNFAVINLSGKLDLFCIISLEDKLLNTIFEAFLPNKISNILQKEMISTLPNEIINTVVGLAISTFPSEYKDLELSRPLAFDSSIIENLKKENYTISKEIHTSSGSLICEIIKG